MPEDTTDIFKRNMLDLYMDRPDLTYAGGTYSIVNSFCYAEFLAHYVLVPAKTDDTVPSLETRGFLFRFHRSYTRFIGSPVFFPSTLKFKTAFETFS